MSSAAVYDPYTPAFQQRSHDVYRALRDHHPVYHNSQRSFWALSRFADVWNAVHDHETFSSEGVDEARALLPMMLYMDPPRHHRLRALVSRAFTPRRVADMEAPIRSIACELLDGFTPAGRGDLLHSFAAQLPSRVIGELIGIPRERREAFLSWTAALVEVRPDGTDAMNEKPALHIYKELAKTLAARRAHGQEDLMSGLLEAEVDGEKLTDQEIIGFCFMLLVAGNDTTMNLIGNGTVLLAQHPEHRERLGGQPALIPNAVEEMVRYEPPVQALPRRTTRDVDLHGERIPAGARVLLIWASANRDEREFTDPDRFDVTRTIVRHLGFGHGVHYCLGASLARLEGRIAFEELLARIPSFDLEAEPTWLTSHWARAHESVRIRF